MLDVAVLSTIVSIPAIFVAIVAKNQWNHNKRKAIIKKLNSYIEQNEFEAAIKTVETISGSKYRDEQYRDLAVKVINQSSFNLIPEIIKRIKKDYDKSAILLLLVQLYLKSGDFKGALNWIERFEFKDQYCKDLAHEPIIKYLIKINKYNEAIKVLDDIKTKKGKRKLLVELTETYIYKGDYESAYQTIRDYEDKYLKIKLITKIVKLMSKNNMKKRANEIISEVDDDELINNKTIPLLIECYINVYRFEAAVDMANKAENPVLQSDYHLRVIDKLLSIEEKEKAVNNIIDRLHIIRTYKDTESKLILMIKIFDRLKRVDDKRIANSLLKEIVLLRSKLSK